jgi:hypothetical protein
MSGLVFGIRTVTCKHSFNLNDMLLFSMKFLLKISDALSYLCTRKNVDLK